MLTQQEEWAAEAKQLQQEREEREQKVAEDQAAKLRTVSHRGGGGRAGAECIGGGRQGLKAQQPVSHSGGAVLLSSSPVGLRVAPLPSLSLLHSPSRSPA